MDASTTPALEAAALFLATQPGVSCYLPAKSAHEQRAAMSRTIEMPLEHMPPTAPDHGAVDERIAHISRWLTQEGRFVSDNSALIEQFCGLIIDAGVPLARSWLHIRALHPEFAGVSRLWRRGAKMETRLLEHGFEKSRTYLSSPVRFMVEQKTMADWRLDTNETLPF